MPSKTKSDHEGMTQVIFTVGPEPVKQKYVPGTRLTIWAESNMLKKFDLLIKNNSEYQSRQDWFEKKIAENPDFPQIIDQDFIKKFDQVLRENGYYSRGEWLREMIRKELSLI